MWSSKASKKTKIAAETVGGAPELSASAEQTAKPRSSRSSKKKETNETGPAKHRNSSIDVMGESAAAATALPGATQAATESPIIDSVGVLAPAQEQAYTAARSSEISASREEIAKLAHSYWVARGYTHGSAEEDWLRAERELKSKR